MLNLGVVLINQGNHAAAEQALLQSVNTQATVENISALAHVFEVNGKPAEAKNCYNVILNAVPDHPPTLAKLAELADQEGDRKEAREWYKKLWDADPTNISAGTAYAIKSFEDDPEETSRAFDKLMERARKDEAAQIKILLALLPYREFHERMKRGLMPYHATSMDELFFKFAHEDFARFRKLVFEQVRQAPDDPRLINREFLAYFCAGELKQAEEVLLRLPNTAREGILATVSFQKKAFANSSDFLDERISSCLPPVITHIPGNFSAGHLIFLCCNSFYFDSFGNPLVQSLAKEKPGAFLHLHIMDITDEQVARITGILEKLPLRAAFSSEQTGFKDQQSQDARNYYHAIRFVRFYQFLCQHKGPLWMMDVDALFNRAPEKMFAVLDGHDVAFRIRPGRLEPWHQFSACIVGAAKTAASLAFFKLIADFILQAWQDRKLSWGIDQLAMFLVFLHLRELGQAPNVALVGSTIADLDSMDEGIVWLTAGKGKFLNSDKANDGPAREKYRQLFRHYGGI